ncbi:MAG: hypothetical protein RMJ98_16935 [Myxococcales bacterium]|nr:hypothetical protein [Polyangiaceae bacterium]MDW8250982.1 hypothetical protein [Myxococcales bacterium]
MATLCPALEETAMPRLTTNPPALSHLEQLVQKARKLRHKGETRKALQTLREACITHEHCAWVWTLYGSYLTQSHRLEEARQAFRHALWLRQSNGDVRRARSTRALLEGLPLPNFAA